MLHNLDRPRTLPLARRQDAYAAQATAKPCSARHGMPRTGPRPQAAQFAHRAALLLAANGSGVLPPFLPQQRRGGRRVDLPTLERPSCHFGSSAWHRRSLLWGATPAWHPSPFLVARSKRTCSTARRAANSSPPLQRQRIAAYPQPHARTGEARQVTKRHTTKRMASRSARGLGQGRKAWFRGRPADSQQWFGAVLWPYPRALAPRPQAPKKDVLQRAPLPERPTTCNCPGRPSPAPLPSTPPAR